MHYRNGREAKDGDEIVKLEGGEVIAVGILEDTVQGDDYCNGFFHITQPRLGVMACLVDCLHVDDVTKILTENALGQRPDIPASK